MWQRPGKKWISFIAGGNIKCHNTGKQFGTFSQI